MTNEYEVTPGMIEAGRKVLLELVAEDYITNDPDWIVAEVWEAMQGVRSTIVQER